MQLPYFIKLQTRVFSRPALVSTGANGNDMIGPLNELTCWGTMNFLLHRVRMGAE